MHDVAVLGAGAIGSVTGAVLAERGRDVRLVGRENHVEAIDDGGLEFRDAVRGETVTVDVDASTSLDAADTVVLGMKTPDVPAGLEQVTEVAPEATVVPLLNGVRADEMAAGAVGRDRVVGGVVLFHAEFLDPGRVTLTRSEPLLVGDPWGGVDERVERIADLFGGTVGGNDRFPVRTRDGLRGARWTKLLVNLNNALPAITGQPVQTVFADDALARVATGALWEGARIVRAAGRPLASLPTAPGFLIVPVSRVPHRLGWRLLRSRVLATLGDDPVRPSTLQSVLRGGASEIDYLNGEIVELGAEIDRPAPINRALVDMVHEGVSDAFPGAQCDVARAPGEVRSSPSRRLGDVRARLDPSPPGLVPRAVRSSGTSSPIGPSWQGGESAAREPAVRPPAGVVSSNRPSARG